MHLAALASTLTIVPLNSAWTTDETATVLRSGRVRLAVTGEGFAAAAQAVSRLATSPAGSDQTGQPCRWWSDDAAARSPSPASSSGTATHTVHSVHSLPAADEGAVALLLFTSGTTGQPKAVPLTHRNLKTNLLQLAQVWERSQQDRVLHVLPAHHFHGLVLALYGSLLAGSPIVMMPRFDARATLDILGAGKADVLMGVPTMYARLLAAADDNDQLGALRLAACGSAPLPVQLSENFRRRFGIGIVERYGLTETGIVAANTSADPHLGTVGRPLPGTDVAIRTEDGELVTGRRGSETPLGEICVRAASVMSAYEESGAGSPAGRTAACEERGADSSAGTMAAHEIRDADYSAGKLAAYEETDADSSAGTMAAHERRGADYSAGKLATHAESDADYATGKDDFVHGYFRTGDLGRIDADGFLHIDGRLKELIIVGGSNVIPAEVQNALADVEGVEEIIIAGLPDDDLGETVAAFVIPSRAAAQAPGCLEESLKARAETTLARYKRPRSYRFVEAIPRNAMGKVDRPALLALA